MVELVPGLHQLLRHRRSSFLTYSKMMLTYSVLLTNLLWMEYISLLSLPILTNYPNLHSHIFLFHIYTVFIIFLSSVFSIIESKISLTKTHHLKIGREGTNCVYFSMRLNHFGERNIITIYSLIYNHANRYSMNQSHNTPQHGELFDSPSIRNL